ncbi:MAG: phosphocarrier protein HPr [Spirochaetales bacterium]|nr:MAG: phosphocarrier protein HPr [Spirochaetales bacterium]
MTTRKVTILNRAGIHARPASMIVQTAELYDSSIWFEKDNARINAKSIMNVLTLEAVYKTELVIGAEGPDEEEAVAELTALFESKFEEE